MTKVSRPRDWVMLCICVNLSCPLPLSILRHPELSGPVQYPSLGFWNITTSFDSGSRILLKIDLAFTYAPAPCTPFNPEQ